uniref:Uncharacterized protein n=1 Tax=Arundo donax TaxID=35708 RepID=A0A0A9CA67_ARUDO
MLAVHCIATFNVLIPPINHPTMAYAWFLHMFVRLQLPCPHLFIQS